MISFDNIAVFWIHHLCVRRTSQCIHNLAYVKHFVVSYRVKFQNIIMFSQRYTFHLDSKVSLHLQTSSSSSVRKKTLWKTSHIQSILITKLKNWSHFIRLSRYELQNIVVVGNNGQFLSKLADIKFLLYNWLKYSNLNFRFSICWLEGVMCMCLCIIVT